MHHTDFSYTIKNRDAKYTEINLKKYPRKLMINGPSVLISLNYLVIHYKPPNYFRNRLH